MSETTLGAKNRLIEISQFLEGRDFSLVLRRITDCIIDIENIPLFRECLKLHDVFEKDNKATSGYIEFENATKALIPKIEQELSSFKIESKPLLSVTNLGKTYRTGNFGISEVNSTVHQGEIIGLVGENGNGKTTLLRMIGGELSPSEGEIEYHYTSDKPGTYKHRSNVVFVPQRIPKWYGSLMDNLMFTNAFYNRKGEDNLLWAEIMVARLGLRDFKHLNWNRISSGYKTRFELARVLLQKPQVLLLDEPLANLDIFAQQTVLQDLKYRAQSLRNPFGVFLTSQQLYEVEKISDSVIFLKNGSPKYQSMVESTVDSNAVFEIESKEPREIISNALISLKPESIKFNGGVYVTTFVDNIDMSELMLELSKSKIDILAVRNISKSSRRFFEA